MKTLQPALKSIVMISVLAISAPLAVQAQAPAGQRTFSSKTEKPMKQALDFFYAKNYSKAEKKFKDVLKIKGLSPFEISTVEQYLGQSTYRSRDYKDSIKHFERAIAAGGLTPTEVSESERILAELHIKNKDYDKALVRAERWFAVKPNKARKDYELMNFLYFSEEQTDKQLAVLQTMTRLWPQDRALWDQQISTLAEAGKAFEAYQAFAGLYDRGLLNTTADLSKLVQYHEYYKRFDVAARILESEMAKGRLERSDVNQARLQQLKRQAGATP